MALTDVNGYPLKWEAQIDTKRAEADAKRLKDLLSGLGIDMRPASESLKELNKETSESAKVTANARTIHLATMEAMAQSRLETQKHREELQRLKVEQQQNTISSQGHKAALEELKIGEQKLRAEYTQGRIALNEYTLEQKKLTDAKKLETEAQRQAERAIKSAAQEQRKLETEQKRAAAEADKRRKQLEKESSEYYKLNAALGAVRKETKDVLAEMFRMERQGHATGKGYQALKNKAADLTKQTLYLDTGIKKIDASLGLHQRNVGNYSSALEIISPQFARINNQMEMMGVSLTDLAGKKDPFSVLGASIVTMGKSLLAFLISPVGLAIAALGGLYALITGNANTVKEFNSGLLNVSKTTGIAGLELDKLGKSIIQLSRELETVPVDKLLEYATVAGQLGVKGTANIMAFSEALAKLETASNISGEQGGAEIARLLTLTDGGVQNVKAFGDEIVNLGNNFAATEAEILSNAESISQNVGIYRIGRQDILAFATATKSVGLEAELVGSTFSRTLAEFEKSIRTGKGVSEILKLVGGSADELQKRFKADAAGVFVDYIGGLNKIHIAGGSVNQALTQTGISAVRDQRVIASLASNGYDVLTDALVKVKEATGALDQEFETASGKLVNQTGRIGIAWDNLVLNIENGTGAIGVATVSITGFFADMLEGLTNVVTSNSWGEFWERVNPKNWGKGQGITDIKEWTGALEEAKEAMYVGSESNGTTWMENEARKLSQGKFAENLEKTKGLYENLKTASIEYEAAVLSGRIKEEKNTVGHYKKQEANLSQYLSNLEKIGKEKGYITDPKKPDPATTTTIELTDAEKRALAARLKAQRAMQSKVDELVQASKRKQLTSNEQEVQSIKDKYAKIREEVKNFYDDPLNKGRKVDLSGLASSESREIEESEAKQQLEADKQVYAEKKVLFDEFEKYRAQVGADEANKRFASDLNGFKNYVEYLKSLMPDTADQSPLANKTRDYLTKTAIPGAEKDELKRQEALYTQALIAAQTHAQRLEQIETEYQSNVAALGESASINQLRVLKEARDQRISDEVAANLKIETNWEGTFENMYKMSRKASVEYLKEVKKRIDGELAAGKLTKKEYSQMAKDIDNALSGNTSSYSKLATSFKKYIDTIKLFGKESEESKIALKELANEAVDATQKVNAVIGAIAQSVQQLDIGDENLDKSLSNVMGIVDGFGEISKGIADKDPIAIITGSIKILTNVIDLFNVKDKKLQKQIDNYRKQLESLGKAYKQLEKDISNSVGNSYYADSDKAIANMQGQIVLIERMRKAEQDKKKTDKGKLAEYDEQIAGLKDSIEETQKAISEMLLQTDFKQFSQTLTDALVSAFEAGENGIDAMNDAFDDFIKNAMANAVKLSLIEPIINDMMKAATAYAKDNNNSLIGFDFEKYRRDLTTAVSLGKEMYEGALDDLGVETDASKQTGGTGMSGMIGKAITEDTANKWMGIQLNIYTINKNMLTEMQGQSVAMKQYSNYAFQNLNAALAIEKNTANTVIELQSAVVELRTIAANTKPSKTGRDLG